MLYLLISQLFFTLSLRLIKFTRGLYISGREQIFIKMIEKSPGVYAVVSDLSNLSHEAKEPANVDTALAEHKTAGSSNSGSSSSSSSVSSVNPTSGLLAAG